MLAHCQQTAKNLIPYIILNLLHKVARNCYGHTLNDCHCLNNEVTQTYCF